MVSYVRIAEWDDIEEDAQPSKKSGKDKDRMKAAELRHNRVCSTFSRKITIIFDSMQSLEIKSISNDTRDLIMFTHARFQTFRKIEQDLKERNRRKQKNMKEEAEAPAVSSSLYVDKDRAIAVGAGKYNNMGKHFKNQQWKHDCQLSFVEQDLKGDILKHRGKLMSDQTNAMLEEFDINVLIEQAGHELRWGDPAVRSIFIVS